MFLDYFGQAIVGHKYFNTELRCKNNFSDSCTVSDEAFGRFTLERCWESWLSGATNKDRPGKCTIKADHTKEKSNKRFGGWEQEGINRFTAIAHLVASDRKLGERQRMEDEYRMSKFDEVYGKEDNIGENSMNNDILACPAYNDLSEEENIDNEEDEDENFEDEYEIYEHEENIEVRENEEDGSTTANEEESDSFQEGMVISFYSVSLNNTYYLKICYYYTNSYDT